MIYYVELLHTAVLLSEKSGMNELQNKSAERKKVLGCEQRKSCGKSWHPKTLMQQAARCSAVFTEMGFLKSERPGGVVFSSFFLFSKGALSCDSLSSY